MDTTHVGAEFSHHLLVGHHHQLGPGHVDSIGPVPAAVHEVSQAAKLGLNDGVVTPVHWDPLNCIDVATRIFFSVAIYHILHSCSSIYCCLYLLEYFALPRAQGVTIYVPTFVRSGPVWSGLSRFLNLSLVYQTSLRSLFLSLFCIGKTLVTKPKIYLYLYLNRELDLGST